MKVILIKGCSSCPYGALWELDGLTYICGVNQKVNKDGHNAPSWCELKDALHIAEQANHEICPYHQPGFGCQVVSNGDKCDDEPCYPPGKLS